MRTRASSETFEKVFAKVYQRQDDLNDSDILAFSATGSGGADGDDELAFGSGGAIMDALAQKNPSFKALE